MKKPVGVVEKKADTTTARNAAVVRTTAVSTRKPTVKKADPAKKDSVTKKTVVTNKPGTVKKPVKKLTAQAKSATRKPAAKQA